MELTMQGTDISQYDIQNLRQITTGAFVNLIMSLGKLVDQRMQLSIDKVSALSSYADCMEPKTVVQAEKQRF